MANEILTFKSFQLPVKGDNLMAGNTLRLGVTMLSACFSLAACTGGVTNTTENGSLGGISAGASRPYSAFYFEAALLSRQMRTHFP